MANEHNSHSTAEAAGTADPKKRRKNKLAFLLQHDRQSRKASTDLLSGFISDINDETLNLLTFLTKNTTIQRVHVQASSTSSSASTMLVHLQRCLGAAFRFLSEHPTQQAGTPLLLPRISRDIFLPWPGEHWMDDDLYRVPCLQRLFPVNKRC
jgi:hypothetical protein